MKEKTKIKIGIADAHGIESYFDTKDNEEKFLSLHLRASANRQRHAVFFIAEISVKEDKEIETLIKKQQYIEALKHLKKVAISIKLDKSGMGDIQDSWDLIPNPKLDPYT